MCPAPAGPESKTKLDFGFASGQSWVVTQDKSASTLRERVATESRRLAQRGLFIGTAGNISARDGDLVAITASGADLAATTADDIMLVDLDGNRHESIPAALRPSSELELHLGVYRQPRFSGLNAVVHTHSRFATTLSTVLDELPVIHYQQLSLGGSVRVAPFHTFGTPDLAHAVHTALDSRLAALMANHGSVTIGPHLDDAVENALLLEWICEIYWRSALVGTPKILDTDAQQGVVEHALAIGYGRPSGQ